jgi:hypothetical protein
MYAADAVIAGGVRRSATICLFSVDDLEMAMAKTGDWFTKNPQRGRSNNSAVIVRSKTTREQFSKLMASIKEFGEPGFVFVESEEHLYNPCVEIGMFPKWEGESGWQGCVSYDTKLITRSGIETIGNVVDENREIEIWNGEKWSKVTPIQTGENRKLYRVYFGDGSYLDATENHRFIVKNRFENNYREVTTLELSDILINEKYTVSVPRSNIVYENGINEPQAYDYGFILGDGTVQKRNNTYRSFACVYETNYNYNFPVTGTWSKELVDQYKGNDSLYKNVYFSNIDNEFAYRMKYDIGLPIEIFSWNKKSILNFLAGWIDTDGTVTKTNTVRIYGEESKIRDAQLLLTKVGINSSVNIMSKKGDVTNIGVRNRDIWYVQIMPSNGLWCSKKELNTVIATNKGLNQTVKNIVELAGLHNSYCFEESELHQGVFNNVLTKQCNLVETNGGMCTSKEEFFRACAVGAVIGTLQAGYTDFGFLDPISKKIFDREALLGVSITGWMNNPDILFDAEILEEGARIVKEVNERVAALIGINPAARTTCSKPSGNACTTFDTMIKTNKGNMSLKDIFLHCTNDNINPSSESIGDDTWFQVINDLQVYDENNQLQEITGLYVNGFARIYEIEFEDGKTYKFTDHHKLKTTSGWKQVCDLTEEDEIISF